MEWCDEDGFFYAGVPTLVRRKWRTDHPAGKRLSKSDAWRSEDFDLPDAPRIIECWCSQCGHWYGLQRGRLAAEVAAWRSESEHVVHRIHLTEHHHL
jgi:hypothetical protein